MHAQQQLHCVTSNSVHRGVYNSILWSAEAHHAEEVAGCEGREAGAVAARGGEEEAVRGGAGKHAQEVLQLHRVRHKGCECAGAEPRWHTVAAREVHELKGHDDL